MYMKYVLAKIKWDRVNNVLLTYDHKDLLIIFFLIKYIILTINFNECEKIVHIIVVFIIQILLKEEKLIEQVLEILHMICEIIVQLSKK